MEAPESMRYNHISYKFIDPITTFTNSIVYAVKRILLQVLSAEALVSLMIALTSSAVLYFSLIDLCAYRGRLQAEIRCSHKAT